MQGRVKVYKNDHIAHDALGEFSQSTQASYYVLLHHGTSGALIPSLYRCKNKWTNQTILSAEKQLTCLPQLELVFPLKVADLVPKASQSSLYRSQIAKLLYHVPSSSIHEPLEDRLSLFAQEIL